MKIKQETIDKIIAFGHVCARRFGQMISLGVFIIILWVVMQVIVCLNWLFGFVIEWMR